MRPLALVLSHVIFPFWTITFTLTFVAMEITAHYGQRVGRYAWILALGSVFITLPALGRRLNRIDPPEKYR